VDCAYGDWQDWGACGRCSGERARFRAVVRYAQHGGKNCQAFNAQEAARCPRSCHEVMYCTWKDWADWSTCSATCGSGGSRSRQRYLHLSNTSKDAILFSVADVMDEYDSLHKLTKDLEARHIHELIIAFVAGCLSLVATLGSLRALGCMRHSRASSLGDAVETTAREHQATVQEERRQDAAGCTWT